MKKKVYGFVFIAVWASLLYVVSRLLSLTDLGKVSYTILVIIIPVAIIFPLSNFIEKRFAYWFK